jgi:Tol biopolymer transport system component
LVGPAQAAFPGRNGDIAYTSDRDGRSQVYVMDADGSRQHNLSNSPHLDTYPAWSPDGKWLAFTRFQRVPTGFEGSDVWVMNAKGRKQRQLTFGGSSGQPAWSPDGRRIAFSSHVGFDSELFVINADGSGRTQLTSNEPGPFTESGDTSPAWAPDGSRIAWFAQRFRGFTQLGYGIYTMNPDGTDEQLLVAGATHADWSPDSAKLLVDCGILCTVNRDGSNLQPVGLGPAIGSGGGGVWSPDGTMVALGARGQTQPSDAEVFIARADGAGLTNLTQHPGRDGGPTWQPR